MNEHFSTPTQLLTVDEVAGILRVSATTVRRMIRFGELGTVEIGPNKSRRRSVRVEPAEVARYIRDNTNPATPWL